MVADTCTLTSKTSYAHGLPPLDLALAVCEELWTEPFHHETEAWVEYPVGASFFNHASACVRVTLAEIDGRLSSGPDNTLVLDLGFSGAATKRLRLEVRGVVWERSLGCDPPEPYWRCREMAELSCCVKGPAAGFEVLEDDRV
ncbi:uncharacterized protein PFL1_06225 [Pseudozyma flocculosa PF-1]|uniref:Uncharacterized protein n=1 Tax=Pseudozyma flocculosa PF-1 TaxID=1277687 RepID=A0A061H361_9BASI|nr:uncharacterized protein PFL1_06225 [Pseudozyma flocculosa PF-1]EPQ26290.1 hypothetical protein PFL1_06225 [Pseudozyma flocculosa PF-1]